MLERLPVCIAMRYVPPAFACTSRANPRGMLLHIDSTATSGFSEYPRLGPSSNLQNLHRLQVVLPLPADWEVEHQVWLEDLQEKQAKPYPQEFINPKRAGGGGGSGSAGAVRSAWEKLCVSTCLT